VARVALAVAHSDTKAHCFDASKDALVEHDRAHAGHLAHDHGKMFVRVGTDGLVAARNAVAQQVIDSDVDWLLWIDSDMGFAPDTLDRLLAVADPIDRPIVGGLCFASRQFAHDGMHGFRTRPMPTIYNYLEVDGVRRFVSIPVYPTDQVIHVRATGSACILIHRSVLELIGGSWYDRVPGSDGKLLGEDISFCVRAATVGAPIHVHTGVRTTHLKPQWVGEQDYWRAFVPPPADERVAVIAADLSEMLERSLVASTGLAKAYPGVAYDGDEPWVIHVPRNVRFHAGWLDHALHIAASFSLPIVGVNSLHPDAPQLALVRRDYLEAACSPDKAIATARSEGIWTVAPGAVVEVDGD